VIDTESMQAATHMIQVWWKNYEATRVPLWSPRSSTFRKIAGDREGVTPSLVLILGRRTTVISGLVHRRVTLGSQNTVGGCCHTLGVVEHHQLGLGIDPELGHQVGSRWVEAEQIDPVVGSLEGEHSRTSSDHQQGQQ